MSLNINYQLLILELTKGINLSIKYNLTLVNGIKIDVKQQYSVYSRYL